MSRAFLKNESADDPVMIPARAPLPAGVANYVTPRGLDLLHAELTRLETERGQVQTHESDENERTRQLTLLNGQIGALNQRIATAKVVVHHDADSVVRFGATVTLRPGDNKSGIKSRRLTIVGVDEADANQGLIAFTAPIARLMVGKRVGETVILPALGGKTTMEIEAISYRDEQRT